MILLKVLIYNDAMSKIIIDPNYFSVYYYPSDNSFHFDLGGYGTFLIGAEGTSTSSNSMHIQYKNIVTGQSIWKII